MKKEEENKKKKQNKSFRYLPFARLFKLLKRKQDFLIKNQSLKGASKSIIGSCVIKKDQRTKMYAGLFYLGRRFFHYG